MSPSPESTPIFDETQAAVTSARQPAPEAEQAPEAPAPVEQSAVGDQSGESYDPTAPYVQGGKTYVPGPPPPVTRLPGEPGYEGGGPTVSDMNQTTG